VATAIKRYEADIEPAVIRFNKRLRKAGVRFQFPERCIPSWLPQIDNRDIFQQMFVAAENEEVRGGYILKSQRFVLQGEERTVGNYGLPLSEGTIDKAYNALGLLLLRDALKRSPQLYALGMGGLERPLPRMLNALGWSARLVPFYFRVVNARRFLLNISSFRRNAPMRALCNLAAWTGVGSLAVNAWQQIKTQSGARHSSVSVEAVSRFGDWADRIWKEATGDYSFAAVRDQKTLSVLYPPNSERFITLLVHRNGQAIGWSVVLDTPMSNHKQFGDMRVGSIIDCMARTQDAVIVASEARRFLEQRGVDIIVSNQSHTVWKEAFPSAGFLAGPSNFGLAMSPVLSRQIASSDPGWNSVHMTRGDGDGPINL
jgi:hypothetical protein